MKTMPVTTRVIPIPEMGSIQLKTKNSTSPTTPKYAKWRRTFRNTNMIFFLCRNDI